MHLCLTPLSVLARKLSVCVYIWVCVSTPITGHILQHVYQSTWQPRNLIWFDFLEQLLWFCVFKLSQIEIVVLSSAICPWLSLSSWLLVIDKSLWLMCSGVSRCCSFMGPRRTLECVWRLDVDLWTWMWPKVCGQTKVVALSPHNWCSSWSQRCCVGLLRSDSCLHVLVTSCFLNSH